MKQYKDTQYFVTEDGKIYRNGKQLSTSLTNKGYKDCHICIDGKRKHLSVHRAVAICYVPNPNDLPQVNHIDGNKLNNHYSNLEWVSNQENRNHAIENGLHVMGEKSPKAIFTNEEILWIRANYIKGDREYGCGALGRKFNTYPSTIHKIIHHQRWKHL